MKIVANKRDEVLKQKAAYDAEVADYEAYKKDADHRYHAAEAEVLEPIENELKSALSHYSVLEFQVRVERVNFFGSERGAEVRIECNENKKFDGDSALSWSFDVKLDSDGQVIKESSSWSGLNATTPEQMKSLRQTVAALEYLNDIDWPSLIDVAMPKLYDYYDKDRSRPKYRNFKQELAEADMADIIGQNKAIKVASWGESCPYNGYCYIKILGETPSQFKVESVPGGWRGDIPEDQVREAFKKGGYEQRVKKANIHPTDPVSIIDLDE